MTRVCDMPGCVLSGMPVNGSAPPIVRCCAHFWDKAPVPEPPEDARAVEFWGEPSE